MEGGPCGGGRRRAAVLAVFTAALVLSGRPGAVAEDSDERWPSSEDAVTGAFEARARRLPDAPGRVRRYNLAFPSGDPAAPAPDNVVPGELYLPADSREGNPAAAVVILHILNGNYEFERLIAGELARHGVAALWFKLPHYGERRAPGERLFNEHSPDRLIDVFDRGALDVRRAFDLLSAHPEVDGSRIGIIGLSMGGMVACHAAALEPRTWGLALLMAGGQLNRLLVETREMRHMRTALEARNAEEQAAFIRELERRDPVQAAEALAHLSAGERVMMINAAEDEVVPTSSAEALAEALGIGDRVVWLPDVGHYTVSAELPAVLERLMVFFEGTPVGHPVSAADPPLGTFAEWLGTLLLGRPEPGKIHSTAAGFSWTPHRGDPVSGRVSWRQDAEGRFRLDAQTDAWGRIVIGQGNRPWLWVEKAGLRMNGDAPIRLKEIGLPSEWDVLRRMAGETLRLGSRVPGLVDEQLGVEMEAVDEGGSRARLRTRRFPGALTLYWPDGAGPVPRDVEARFDAGLLRLEEMELRLDAVSDPADYEPPMALASVDVGTRDLALFLMSLLGVSAPGLPGS